MKSIDVKNIEKWTSELDGVITMQNLAANERELAINRKISVKKYQT